MSDIRGKAMPAPRVGTAGWSIPAAVRDRFPPTGTGLERYVARFDAVEINSSFYRPHRLATWQRWAAMVPAAFSFSVKLPKAISHVARLVAAEGQLAVFAQGVAALGDKLGVILVQLPPSLALDPQVAHRFFAALADAIPQAGIACEPRHPSWFTSQAGDLLAAHRVARVAADPAILPDAARPGGWPGLRYWRLHGSPTIYRSSYDGHALDAIAADMATRRRGTRDWCIFDNTASGAAAADALALREMTAPGARPG